MNGDGVEVESGDLGGISIWAGADPESESQSKSKSKAKAKAASESPASTQANSTQANSIQANFTQPELKLTPKQLGEIAEAEFIAKAVGLGFVVAKPWGDSEPYDFIVNPKKSFIFWRVQVKSAHVQGRDKTYSFGARDGARRSYTAEDIDALVAYARPEEAWYVLPVRVVEGLKALKLSPGSRNFRSKYEKWREKWEILRRAVRRVRRK
jgi:hypothetical protein